MTIKAIETRYKGYRFRSRLEARWAVFFDALKLQWEYEPEGYELPGGAWYLPDFYFPQIHAFGEVKPAHDPAEIDRAVSLCKKLTEGTGKECLLLFGEPKWGLWATSTFDEYTDRHGEVLYPRRVDGIPYAWTAEEYWTCENRMFSYPGEERDFPLQFDAVNYDTPEVFRRALSAFKSARFEHGEAGA